MTEKQPWSCSAVKEYVTASSAGKLRQFCMWSRALRAVGCKAYVTSRLADRTFGHSMRGSLTLFLPSRIYRWRNLVAEGDQRRPDA